MVKTRGKTGLFIADMMTRGPGIIHEIALVCMSGKVVAVRDSQGGDRVPSISQFGKKQREEESDLCKSGGRSDAIHWPGDIVVVCRSIRRCITYLWQVCLHP